MPYFTVLNLGIKKSEFRRLWLDNNTLRRWIIFPVINLNFTVYIRIAISCKRLFSRLVIRAHVSEVARYMRLSSHKILIVPYIVCKSEGDGVFIYRLA